MTGSRADGVLMKTEASLLEIAKQVPCPALRTPSSQATYHVLAVAVCSNSINHLYVLASVVARCVFSVGGDGALHVLDDADATGYVKPVSMADGTSRRKGKGTRDCPSATGRGAGCHGGNNISKGEGTNDEKAPGKTGQEAERRNPGRRDMTVLDEKRSETKRSEKTGSGKRGSGTTCNATREAAVAVDPGRGSEAQEGKKGRDEGWSVLLRQVAFASGESDDENHDSDQGESGGHSQSPSRGRLRTINAEVSAPDDDASAMDQLSDSSTAADTSSKPRLGSVCRTKVLL